MQITFNTARIANRDGLWVVEFQNGGSFTNGTQHFGGINPALRFCRERGLRVVSCEC